MNNLLTYKGYHSKIEVDIEKGILFGKVEGIRDLVNFESSSLQDIVKEFHEAVDDYLSFCDEVGKQPDKEYKGTFNVRISPALHRKASVFAFKKKESLNQIVEEAIDSYVNNSNVVEARWDETITTTLKLININPCNQKINTASIPKVNEGYNCTLNYGNVQCSPYIYNNMR